MYIAYNYTNVYVTVALWNHLQGISALQVLNAQHREVVASLQPLYSVFVDTLEFRDLAYETITSIASSQVHLDIVSLYSTYVCSKYCTCVSVYAYSLL